MKPEQILYRQRVLPEQLVNARLKYLRLVREARQLGMAEILTNTERYNEAWEREVLGAKIECALRGGVCSLGPELFGGADG